MQVKVQINNRTQQAELAISHQLWHCFEPPSTAFVRPFFAHSTQPLSLSGALPV